MKIDPRSLPWVLSGAELQLDVGPLHLRVWNEAERYHWLVSTHAGHTLYAGNRETEDEALEIVIKDATTELALGAAVLGLELAVAKAAPVAEVATEWEPEDGSEVTWESACHFVRTKKYVAVRIRKCSTPPSFTETRTLHLNYLSAPNGRLCVDGAAALQSDKQSSWVLCKLPSSLPPLPA